MAKDEMKIIGVNIKSYRKRMKLKQIDLANFLGVDRAMISYYEEGSRNIPLSRLEKLADLFGVDLYELLEDSNSTRAVNYALAFRAGEINSNDLYSIANFRKIVKNYTKIKELCEKYDC